MKFSFHLLLTCIALTACGESGKTTADYRIVPRPGEIAPGDGGDFELDARTRIVCTGDGDGMRANAEFLAGYVESVVGSAPEITGPDCLCDDGRAVILRADAPGKGGEAYEIEVSENRITVSGESDAGVFYGIQRPQAMGAAKAASAFPGGPHRRRRIWATGA
ncbi:MAG: glycoside hydrolase family 20 zincin-like fold domain-containing protein [Alistipes finegoldii]